MRGSGFRPPGLGSGFILLLGALTGCATGGGLPSPAEVPTLRAAFDAAPEDSGRALELGLGLFAAGSLDEARTYLTRALEGGARADLALLHLGMIEEASEEWGAARARYTAALDEVDSGRVREELRNRIALVGQRLLREEAARALAQEATLAAADPTPGTLAILPFAFNSDREELEPLIYALSDMMTTDFAVSGAVRVLERSQVQVLLDEMALTEAGYADPDSGARAGRMLRAENILQGVLSSLDGDRILLRGDVRGVRSGSSLGQSSAEDELQRLFDIEKELVLRTFREVLRVELTPAEEQRIGENRARNLQAFLAYGRGLRERDRGDFEAALTLFREAQQLDPGFGAVGAAVEETAGLAEAAEIGVEGFSQVAASVAAPSSLIGPPPSVSAFGLGSGTGGSLPSTAPATATDTGDDGNPAGGSSTGGSSTLGTLTRISEGVNPTPNNGTLGGTTTGGPTGSTSSTDPGGSRNPVQESQGQEGSTGSSKAEIRIVIRRPGGDQ